MIDFNDREAIKTRALKLLAGNPCRNSELIGAIGYETGGEFRKCEDAIWELYQEGRINIGPDSVMRVAERTTQQLETYEQFVHLRNPLNYRAWYKTWCGWGALLPENETNSHYCQTNEDHKRYAKCSAYDLFLVTCPKCITTAVLFGDAARDRFLELERAAGEVLTKPTIKYRRGEADGRMGHPPAEVTETYLQGYSDGIKKQP